MSITHAGSSIFAFGHKESSRPCGTAAFLLTVTCSSAHAKKTEKPSPGAGLDMVGADHDGSAVELRTFSYLYVIVSFHFLLLLFKDCEAFEWAPRYLNHIIYARIVFF